MGRRSIPKELRKLPVSVPISDVIRDLVERTFPGRTPAQRLREAVIAGLAAAGAAVPWGMR